MYVELVFVHYRARSAGSSVFERTAKFTKEAKSSSDVKVCMKEVALQHVPVGVLRGQAEVSVVETLISLPELPSQRKENGLILRERNEFHRIPQIVAL